MSKSAARSVGSSIAREITRGVLGSILGGATASALAGGAHVIVGAALVAIEAWPLSEAIRRSVWAYPALETIHIAVVRDGVWMH